MKQNYFVSNGVKYYTGSIFITNNMGKHDEATFICYDTDINKYVYSIKECMYYIDDRSFWRTFISVTDKTNKNAHMPVVKTKRDFEICGMALGWVWYIFLMAVSTIFNGAVFLWLLISIVFFHWRDKKIKEEGTYIEW